MKIRVYYEDTDIGGIVYHSQYLNFCERARSEMFFSVGKTPLMDSIGFVIRDLRAKFINSATLGDFLEVKTKVITLKSASLLLKQTVFKDEKIIFEMELTLACVKNGRIIKMPSYFTDLFKGYK
jgi:acyl-CoA thioester hydrolase